MRPNSVEEIVAELTRGTHETYFSPERLRADTPWFAPWTLINSMDGEKLGSWYETNKPDDDLGTLKSLDREKYLALLAGKQALAQIEESLAKVRVKDGRSYQERTKQHEEFITANPNLKTEADAYLAWRQGSIYAHVPTDFPHTRIHLYVAKGLVYYGLFYNPETSEYLVTMRDARLDITGATQPKSLGRSNIVEHQVINDKNLTEEEASLAARRIWSAHFCRLYRFAPITARTQVAAMEEAERIRTLSRQITVEPARPDRKLFEFFSAFQRAYQGETGYLRALHDIFGRNGNMTYLMSLGVPCSGAPYGGVENNTKYGVASDHFVVLYTKMSEQDRANFRNAFDNFVLRDLPDIKQSAPWHADELLEPMAWLATTIQHGSGIIEDKPRLFAAWDAATRELSALLRNKPVLPGTRPSSGLRFSDYDPHAVLRAT